MGKDFIISSSITHCYKSTNLRCHLHCIAKQKAKPNPLCVGRCVCGCIYTLTHKAHKHINHWMLHIVSFCFQWTYSNGPQDKARKQNNRNSWLLKVFKSPIDSNLVVWGRDKLFSWGCIPLREIRKGKLPRLHWLLNIFCVLVGKGSKRIVPCNIWIKIPLVKETYRESISEASHNNSLCRSQSVVIFQISG